MWLFGWGTFSNAKNIQKINQNLQMLQEQNNLQEAQVLELIHYIMFMMVEVHEHWGAFCKLDNRLLIFIKT